MTAGYHLTEPSLVDHKTQGSDKVHYLYLDGGRG